MHFLFLFLFSFHASAGSEVENLCLEFPLKFLESTSEERLASVERVKPLLRSQNAFCPGKIESIIFAKRDNSKAKLSLYTELAMQSLLNLENIAGQVWSENEFKKNYLETQKLIDQIEDPLTKMNFQKWLKSAQRIETEKRPTAKRNPLIDCSPASVDQKRMPPNRLQIGPEGGVGWCYAFSAAQLIGYEIGNPVSAPDVALSFNRKYFQDRKFQYSLPNMIRPNEEFINTITDLNNSSNPEKISKEQMKRLLSYTTSDTQIVGGLTGLAIEESLHKGICLEKDFKSDYSAEGSQPVFDAIQRLQALGNLSQVLCSKSLSDRVMSRFPGLESKDLVKIFSNPNDSGDIVDLLRDKSCKRKKASFQVKKINCDPHPRFGGAKPECSKQIYDAIIERLNKGKPIGLSFMGNGLNGANGSLPGHAVVIIQKKYDPELKECLFKVRDSNEAKDYWVTEGQFMSRAFAATYIE